MPERIGVGGKTLGQDPIPEAFAGEHVGSHTIFRAVFRECANERSGTHSTKRRDEVSGGGKKPWKQKGTGRARQGSTRSPQWRHGGIVFGPKPRSYVSSLNRKERRAAMLAALADRYTNNFVTHLDVTGIAIEKTADFAQLIFGGRRNGDAGPATLLVFAESERAGIGGVLERTGRNLRAVKVVPVTALDVRDIVGSQRLIFTTAAATAIAQLGERS